MNKNYLCRNIVLILMVAVFYILINSLAYSQSITIADKSKEDVWINGKLLKDMEIKIGDTITTGKKGWLAVKIIWTSEDFENFTLRENSSVVIDKLFSDRLLSLTKLDGKIELKGNKDKNKVKKKITVNTYQGTNIAAKGTHFSITSRKAGTILDVIEGKVELTREGEDKGVDIVRDYKAFLTEDGSITTISPRPLYMQIGLSVALPGTGKIYARRDIKVSIATRILSLSSLVGFVVGSTVRENASKVGMQAYDDYKTETDLNIIKKFYDRHRNNVNKANKYRKIQIGSAALYGLLALCETISTVRDGLAFQKMISDTEKLDEKLSSSSVGLETRDNSLLSKAEFRF
jgi:hypothetical protein